MLSSEITKVLKEKGYSFEQIQWIELWLSQSEKWDILSQSEMDAFIQDDLFAKYSVHA
jgi:hypothetical protein